MVIDFLVFFFFFFFFFKQKTAYEMLRSLVGSEMCIRDSVKSYLHSLDTLGKLEAALEGDAVTRELVIGAEASGVSGGGGGTAGVDLLEGVDALSLLVEEHLKMHGLAQ
eukprot:TRINITY_DN2513_c0_g1_i6.p1 TRINITY_DN2513_c0_g1~~TRINITY_DN2513_c0_g1_i6.p1  ORF type:complete len:109 (-),score=45.06 TRINITY_DN2513_c0_g1_i6:231-557(-)